MKKYKFTLTEEQVNIVLNALAMRPYFEVTELIAEIHQQAAEQEDTICKKS